jgi:hypothetical protein
MDIMRPVSETVLDSRGSATGYEEDFLFSLEGCKVVESENVRLFMEAFVFPTCCQ